MILLLAVAAWMLTVSLVIGLCVAARAGDTQLAHTSTQPGKGAWRTVRRSRRRGSGARAVAAG
jgi:hypothetical protein